MSAINICDLLLDLSNSLKVQVLIMLTQFINVFFLEFDSLFQHFKALELALERNCEAIPIQKN